MRELNQSSMCNVIQDISGGELISGKRMWHRKDRYLHEYYYSYFDF